MSESSQTAERLHRLFGEQWEAWMQASPTWASTLGDRRFDDRWEQATVEAERAQEGRDLTPRGERDPLRVRSVPLEALQDAGP